MLFPSSTIALVALTSVTGAMAGILPSRHVADINVRDVSAGHASFHRRNVVNEKRATSTKSASGSLTLDAAAVQTGSQSDGNDVPAAGQSASATYVFFHCLLFHVV